MTPDPSRVTVKILEKEYHVTCPPEERPALLDSAEYLDAKMREVRDTGKVVGLEEKPAKPRSNYAVTGLYFYDGRASDYAARLEPSPRGELEITDLNRCYLEQGDLHLEKLGRGYAWLDTGTHESLVEASTYIQTIEKRQGLRVCCPEEIAYFNGWIDAAQLRDLARPLVKNGYGQYLLGLLEHGQVE